MARRQRGDSYLTRLGAVAPDNDLALSIEQLGTADLGGVGYCFLFDVAEAGRGELLVTVTAGEVLLAESQPVDMWLRHVKTLYERTSIDWPADVGDPWEYRDEQPPEPDLRWRPDPLGYEFDRPWYDTKDTIVWIYGWLRSGEGRYEQATTQSGETVFKRLWHRGYRGRLVLFHWPTIKPRLVSGLLRSEYRALKCGPVLKNYVQALPADRRVHVTAHSMGNVLLLEALKLGLEADNALLQVAAIPAGAVDSRDVLTLPDMAAIKTPDTADEGGWRAYLTETRTRLYSMYSYSDRTFIGWNIGQKQLKPTSMGGARYLYRPEAEPEDRLILSYRKSRDSWGERPVTDPHESMAFIAQSKTHALGAEARVKGLIHDAFDLARQPYNFGPGHVAGWTRNPQQTTEFYILLLDIFSIPYTSALL